MLFSTVGQGSVFLWMLAAGAVIAVWYGACAALRRLLRAGFWLSLTVDVGFGVGAAVLFSLALYAANYGELRLYAVLGSALGFALGVGALYSPARSAFRGLRQLGRHIVVKIRRNRWINVIFR